MLTLATNYDDLYSVMFVVIPFLAGLHAGLFSLYYFLIRPRGLGLWGKRAVIGASVAFCVLAPAGFFGAAVIPVGHGDRIFAAFASMVVLGSVVLGAAVWFDTRSRGVVVSIVVAALLAALIPLMVPDERGDGAGVASLMFFPAIPWHAACWFGVWVYARPRWQLAAQALAMRCRSCGYDMRGLGTGAVCPECGKLIRDVR